MRVSTASTFTPRCDSAMWEEIPGFWQYFRSRQERKNLVLQYSIQVQDTWYSEEPTEGGGVKIKKTNISYLRFRPCRAMMRDHSGSVPADTFCLISAGGFLSCDDGPDFVGQGHGESLWNSAIGVGSQLLLNINSPVASYLGSLLESELCWSIRECTTRSRHAFILFSFFPRKELRPACLPRLPIPTPPSSIHPHPVVSGCLLSQARPHSYTCGLHATIPLWLHTSRLHLTPP